MKWVLRAAALLALLALGIGATLWWLVGTAPGLRWSAHLAHGVTDGKLAFQDPDGALGGTMRFSRITCALDGMTIEASGVEVRTDLGALPGRALAIDRLHIDRLVVHLQPAQDTRAAAMPVLPASLALPLDLRFDAGTIGVLEVVSADSVIRVRDLYLSYEGGGQRHHLRSLRADTEFGLVGAAGSIAAAQPYAIDLGLALLRPGRAERPGTSPTSLADLPADARVHLSGTLREPNAAVQATLAQVRANIRAVLTPFDRQWPESLRQLEASTTSIDLANFAPAVPHTAITLQANAHGSGKTLAGNVDVRNAQAGPLDRARVPVASFSARFTTDFASARIDEFAIELQPGGALTGRGEVQRAPLSARMDVKVEGIDLHALRSDLRETALGGTLRIDVDGLQQQTLSATLTQDDLRIAANAKRSGDVIDVADVQLAARGGAVTGNARVLLATPTQFNAALAFSRFDPARFGSFPAGSINGRADIAGRLGEPRQVDASWTIARSTLRGRPLASRGRAQVIGERVASVDGSARLGVNELVVRGAYGAPNDRLQWRLDAPALAQLAEGLSGQVQATGTVSGVGTRLQAALTANGRELRLPAGVRVRSVRIEGRAGMQPDSPLAVALSAQQVAAPQGAVDRLAFDITGTRTQHEAVLQVDAERRKLELRLRGGWSGQWPGKWAGELAAAQLRGALPGDAVVRLAAPASLAVAPDNVAARSFRLVVTGGGAPDAEFSVADLAWQPGRLATSGAFHHLSTRWLAAFVSLPEGMETSVSFAGAWSIRAQPRLTGTLSIQREEGDIRLAGPPAIDAGLSQAALNARFDEGRVAAQLDVTAKLAMVRARATIDPARGAEGLGITPDSPVAFDAQLDIAELRLITEPLQTFARLSGRVAGNARGSGTLGAPRIEGSLAADALGVDVPPYGVQLVDGRVRAQLQGDSVNVTELTIRGGDGRFTGSGTLPLRPAAGRADLAWRAENFRLLNRPDMRLVMSGNGRAGFADRKFGLRGEIRADSGHFELALKRLPEPGPDVEVLGQEPPPAQGATSAPLELDLQLDLGKNLSLRGYGLDGKATGRLHLTTNGKGELRAAGRVQAADAIFRAYGQQLVVDPGILVFDGPIDNPTLQITAWRRNQQVEAGMKLSGTAKAPRVALVSQPEVPEGERLSWLVLGRAPSNAQGADLALLQGAAGALLGGGDSVPLTQKMANSIGLDELAVRSSSEIASSVVAVGKRLSNRLLITYEHGLGAAAENLVKLDYSLTRRISMRAETGTTTGLGVFYRFAWD